MEKEKRDEEKKLPQYRLKLEYEDREVNHTTLVEKNFDGYMGSQFEDLIQEIATSLQAIGFGKELIQRYMEVDLQERLC